MTYPPQPGQQPDPYGRQPPSGGSAQPAWDPNQQQPYPTQQYPQGWNPAQQQPAWDPNTQQQYGQQPYGQPGWDPNAQQQQPYGQPWGPGGGQVSGWGPPPPPKKSRTGLWVALAAVVVVLAAVGVTGFVAPGFFLSKPSDSASGQGKVAPVPSTKAPSLPVPSSKPPSSGGGGADTAGGQLLKQFIDKLNAGDDTGALALGCDTSKPLIQDWLKVYTQPPRQLTLGKVDDAGVIVSADVTGKAGGRDVSGTVSAENFDGKGFCVFTFIV